MEFSDAYGYMDVNAVISDLYAQGFTSILSLLKTYPVFSADMLAFT